MTEDELQNRVVYNVRALRKAKKLSQEKLADKADISRQMMNDFEGGRRFLSKSTLVKVANALEVDIHELFIPSKMESEKMQEVYNVVTQKVTEDLRNALNSIIDEMQSKIKSRQ